MDKNYIMGNHINTLSIITLIGIILAFIYAPLPFAFGFSLILLFTSSIISFIILAILTATLLLTGWYNIWWVSLFLFPICQWILGYATTMMYYTLFYHDHE